VEMSKEKIPIISMLYETEVLLQVTDNFCRLKHTVTAPQYWLQENMLTKCNKGMLDEQMSTEEIPTPHKIGQPNS